MQSRIKDAEKRELIDMLRSVLGDIDRDSKEGRHYASLSSVYGKLLRMWMEN